MHSRVQNGKIQREQSRDRLLKSNPLVGAYRFIFVESLHLEHGNIILSLVISIQFSNKILGVSTHCSHPEDLDDFKARFRYLDQEHYEYNLIDDMSHDSTHKSHFRFYHSYFTSAPSHLRRCTPP
jgi:hypothetical protein